MKELRQHVCAGLSMILDDIPDIGYLVLTFDLKNGKVIGGPTCITNGDIELSKKVLEELILEEGKKATRSRIDVKTKPFPSS